MVSRLVLQLELLAERFAVLQLAPDSAQPEWFKGVTFYSLTRTPDELSIVLPENTLPEGMKAERGWRCLVVKGHLDFATVGVLASVSGPLAAAGIPLLVVSTYNTDYVLVKAACLESSIQVLRSAGHHVETGPHKPVEN